MSDALAEREAGGKAGFPVRRKFARGTSIFKEGERADCAYILESGKVEIYKVIGGRRVTLGVIEQWGIFGELGLIDDSPRMAGAYVSEPAVCMVVSKESVNRLLDDAPQGLQTLIHSLVQVIRTAGTNLAEARFQLLERQKLG
jgi:CRP-like cAMP-binding protein